MIRSDTQSADAPPLVSLRSITKSFPGVRALDRVDLTLRRGEIHALMGENGAGKSTLIKVLTGVYRSDGGEMLLDGRAIRPDSPLAAQRCGISTVYQEVNLIPALTVAENLYLGRQPRRFGAIDWKACHAGAQRALERLDVRLDVRMPLGAYPMPLQQMVAIARALDISAKVLILDEPTSSLDANEVKRLFDVMRRLKAQGLGILFVTHFLGQVYEVSDRITVLRNGRRVGEFDTAALPRLALVAHMIGREIAEGTPAQAAPPADAPEPARPAAFLRVRGLHRDRAIAPFDLDVAAGEAVGIGGLLGSGRTETVRLLFGADKADGGTVEAGGTRVRLRSPRDAIAHGLGFCPEDRKSEGIIPELSVRENIVLALQARLGWLRRLSRRRQERLVAQYIEALGIRTPDAESPVKSLSGGNQQKVLLARWLAIAPRLLILDEPTRGIDVGAKFEIARLMRTLCAKGMSLLFVSSELEEVARSSDRVVVLRDRRKVGELRGPGVSEAAIMKEIAHG